MTALHTQQFGNPRNATLVLIHGFAASSNSWRSLVPLVAASHCVISVDLLGHGRSPKPIGNQYSIQQHAEHVGATLDGLGVEGAIIVGHSTGGAVATALAEQCPTIVRALALVNTGPSLEAAIAPRFDIDADQWSQLTDLQIRRAMEAAFSRSGYEPPQELVDDVRAIPYHAFAATLRASQDYLVERTLPDRLTTAAKPLLVIFGADDRRWRASSAADYQRVPGATVALLPGLGHTPLLEDPVQTARPLLDFAAALAHD